MMTKTKICPFCGKQFPTQHSRKFCSPTCSKEAARVNARNRARNFKLFAKPKTCPQCGNSFQPANSHQKYCSKACSNHASKIEPRLCSICGNYFEPKSSAQKYCSPQCSYQSEQLRKKQLRLAKIKPALCRRCGATFIPNKARQIYCSDKCRQASALDSYRAKKKRLEQDGKQMSAWHNFIISTSIFQQEPQIHWYDDTPARQAIRARYGNHSSQIPDSLKGCTDVDKLLDWIFGENQS